MTRLALASFGCGFTCGLCTIALVGERTCVSLSFAAGIVVSCLVLFLAACGVVWAGWKLGWITPWEHSQHGGD